MKPRLEQGTFTQTTHAAGGRFCFVLMCDLFIFTILATWKMQKSWTTWAIRHVATWWLSIKCNYISELAWNATCCSSSKVSPEELKPLPYVQLCLLHPVRRWMIHCSCKEAMHLKNKNKIYISIYQGNSNERLYRRIPLIMFKFIPLIC